MSTSALAVTGPCPPCVRPPQGLDDLVDELAKPGKFLSDVDYICISDNYW